MERVKCEDCSFFAYEDIDGRGICQIKKVCVKCDDDCWLDYDIPQTINVLHHVQKWRRGCNIPMPNPTVMGKAIDKAIHELRKLNKEK